MTKKLRLGSAVQYRDNEGAPFLAFVMGILASEPFSDAPQSAHLKVVPRQGQEYRLDNVAQGEGPGTFSVL